MNKLTHTVILLSLYFNHGVAQISPVEIEGHGITTSPADPISMGRILDNGTTALQDARGIFVSGGYAYVASREGLEILDISDPANPSHIGAILDNATTALQGANSIFVIGKYAYVAAIIDDGVEILDISDPTNPTHVGAITDNSTTALDGASDIFVRGKYAYVTAAADDGLEVLDISDPTNPIHVGAITESATTVLNGALAISVLGRHAYVISVLGGRLDVLDISDPTSPFLIGGINMDLLGPADIVVRGKYAYVTSVAGHGVEIINVSDPTTPIHVGSITDDGDTVLKGARSISVIGNYAYVASEGTSEEKGGVEILDISDPFNPKHLGAVEDIAATALAEAYGIFVSGKYAFVATVGGESGVQILDIAGSSIHSSEIGSVITDQLDVTGNTQIGNLLNVHGGLNVGLGGILSQGDVAVEGDMMINKLSFGEDEIRFSKSNHDEIMIEVDNKVQTSVGVGLVQTRNTFVGVEAGLNTEPEQLFGSRPGSENSFYGFGSGKSNTTGFENSFFGEVSGATNTTGFRNSYFGRGAGANNNGNLNVFLGYNSGADESGSNKLYIANSDTPSPLIYGEFDNNRLVVNGSFEATQFQNDDGTSNISFVTGPDSDILSFKAESHEIASMTEDRITVSHQSTAPAHEKGLRIFNTGGSANFWNLYTVNGGSDAGSLYFYNKTNTASPAFKISASGVINPPSDVHRKELFLEIDPDAILQKIASLPVSEWQFKGEDIRHVGPTAQDFYAAFRLGGSDISIATVDADGVALAAIKALKKENDDLRRDLTNVMERLSKLENRD